MDSEKRASPRSEVSDSEADINMLIYKAGKSIKRLIILIGQAFAMLGTGILLTLLFLLKNIVWILIGLAIGFGYGIYDLSKKGPEFYSEMTVKTNFNSSRSLYNSIDYFNSLIATGKKDQLSELFRIPANKAQLLVSFSVEPVKSEIISADLYREQFLQFDRARKIRQDTFWTRIIKYEDFKESLTNFDYPYHTITVKASDPSVFPHLQQGIINQVSGNQLLQQIRHRQQIINQDEEKLIVDAIEDIDTLRRAYNERLTRGERTTTPNSNQLTILQSMPEEVTTPELELYDKMLELQDELKRTRKRSAIEKDIIEVFSPFAPAGNKISLFNSLSRFVLLGLLIPVVVLSVIALYKWLLLYDKTRKKNTVPVESRNI